MAKNTSGKGNKIFSVGFGKPPKDFQFKKGQSGNPQGRPKGSKNIRTLINQELDIELIIQKHGVSKLISKREAIIKRFIAEALKGDFKALELLFKQVGTEVEKVDFDINAFALDAKVLESYEKHLYDTFKKRELSKLEEGGQNND